ncbi:MAG: DUF692 family protein [Rickettsiales bacterium]|nr:DUF692 family protein [Rickettsiales bacterium]
MQRLHDLPFLGYGIGLRTPHYAHILEQRPAIDWFEIISENFMDTGGKPRRILEQMREQYPIVMHGVSLSIGTVDPLNSQYLKQLKALADDIDPAWISDHLCWTGIAHKNTHDLLPVPYTEEALRHIVGRIREVQDTLEQPILLENPSTYLEFRDSSMPEWEFIARMAEEANCGLLLDVNNIYVSCYNHRWDPKQYLDAVPAERVVQIHLAGHTNKGTHIVDTHDGHVIDAVWDLYRYAIARLGETTTMVEWDDDIPDFDTVHAEVLKAKTLAEHAQAPNQLPEFPAVPVTVFAAPTPITTHFTRMQEAILSGKAENAMPESWIPPKPDFSPEAQLRVYIDGYRYRLFDIVSEEYPVLRHYLGDDRMDALIRDYIEAQPSRHFNVSRYVEPFPEFIATQADAPAQELALLETAISRLFDAEETPALDQATLQGIDAELLIDMHLPPRNALRLLAFTHGVNEYYQAMMEEKEPPSPEATAQFVAVYRHEDRMWRLELEPQEYQLLSRIIQEGATVGMALEGFLQAVPESEQASLLPQVQHWFQRWASHGLLATPAN